MSSRLDLIVRVLAAILFVIGGITGLALAIIGVVVARPLSIAGLGVFAGALGAFAAAVVLRRVAGGRRPSKVGAAVGALGVVTAIVAVLLADPLLHGALIEPSLIAAMRSQLRNLAVAESTYYAAHAHYTTDLHVLEEEANWGQGSDVTVLVRHADSTSWSATATVTGSAYTCSATLRRLDAGVEARRQQPMCAK